MRQDAGGTAARSGATQRAGDVLTMRRLSTLNFARRAIPHLPSGQKLAEAIDRPQVRDILDTMDANDAARFFVLAPVQGGKSAIGQLRMLRNHLVRARQALWYGVTNDFSKDFASLKLNPLFDAIPDLKLITPVGDKTRNSKDSKRLAGGATHLLLSAKTENDRTGKTGCDIYRDESHLWDDGWIGQTSNRRGDFPEEFTETDMSTGLTAGTDAAAAWALTNQKTWHCRCPACGELFEPRYGHYSKDGELIGGLRYEKKFLANSLPDQNRIAASLAYECPNCHARFPDSGGSRLQFSGTIYKPVGQYVPMNPEAAPRLFGWTFHAISFRPWLPIVMRFELAQLAKQRGDYEKLAECVREEFAGIWNPMREMAEQKKRPIGDYVMGEEWALEGKDLQGRPWRFCTVDVQLDHYVVVIRTWGPFSESRLVWAQKVTTPGHIADLCALHRVPPDRTILDGRHATDRVRHICGQMGWRVFMGEGTVKDYAHLSLGGIRRIYSEPRSHDPWIGTSNQGQGIIIEFNFSKSSALDRWHNLRTLETNDGRPMWTAAKDAPEWYFREIDAYYRVPKKSETGQMSYLWAVGGPDHGADAEIMGVVGASMTGLVGAEALETPVEAKVEPEPATA
jgi:hypothetical protein